MIAQSQNKGVKIKGSEAFNGPYKHASLLAREYLRDALLVEIKGSEAFNQTKELQLKGSEAFNGA